MKKLLLTLSFLCLWTDLSGAVSRVGGGKVSSQSSGFQMQVPPHFSNLKSIGNAAVRAEGPAVYKSGIGVTSQFVDITEFQSEFPDLTDYRREQIQQRLSESRWQEVSSHQDCALIMKSTNSQIVAIIATWGKGKGFVLKGPRLSEVDRAMQEMLSTLTLEPGSCAWN